MEFNLEVSAKDGKVYTNASDLLPEIQNGLKHYDYVVDENNYKQAKTDRTALNNLVKIVSDKRKQVENDVFAQWIQDKKDIMAVEKTIKAASDKLGAGINDVDNAEKELKRNQIKELWSNMTNDKYPFDLVFEERYLNKTVKNKEIEESLNNKFLKAEEQLSFIEASLPDDELQAEQVIQLFCKTLDLSKATDPVKGAPQFGHTRPFSLSLASLVRLPTDLIKVILYCMFHLVVLSPNRISPVASFT